MMETDDMDSVTTEVACLDHRPSSSGAGDIHDDDDNDNDFYRPILVGYAFGPKKMSTMTLVMAEATRSMMTEGGDGHEDSDDDDDDGLNHHEVHEPVNHNEEHEDDDLENDNDDEPLSGTPPTLTTQSQQCDNNHKDQPLLLLSSSSSSCSTSPFRRSISHGTGGSIVGNSCDGGGGGGDMDFSKAIDYFRSSCSSSVTASDTVASTVTCLETMTTTTMNTKVGGGELGSGDFYHHHHRPVRVSFVPLDLDIPLEEQHGGNMDIILHKLTEDILWVSRNSKKRPSLVSEKKATTTSYDDETISATTTMYPIASSAQQHRIERLLQYKKDHMYCTLVDDPTRVQVVMNRADIALVLRKYLVGVTSTSGWPVRSPRCLVVNPHDHDRDDDNDDMVWKRPNEWNEKLRKAGIRYPIIVKPLTAAGTKSSHSMAILFRPSGLEQFLTKIHQNNSQYCGGGGGNGDDDGGYLWQEYVNHNAVLFKIYVLGPHVRVYPRPSLPDLPCGGGGGAPVDEWSPVSQHPKQAMLEFDSQRPYPQIEDFFDVSDASISSRVLPAPTPLCDYNISVEEVQPIVQTLKRAFGLELFGFDVLVTTKSTATTPTTDDDDDRNENHDSMVDPQPELWVVDVNYFPSYKEVYNFPALLAQYLTERAIEGRRQRTTHNEGPPTSS